MKHPKRRKDKKELAAEHRGKEMRKPRRRRRRKCLRRSSLPVKELLDQFSRRRRVPFCRTPAPRQSFTFRTDQVRHGQPPGAVLAAHFSIRVERDRISDLQLLDEIDGVLFAVLDGNGEDNEVVLLIFLV